MIILILILKTNRSGGEGGLNLQISQKARSFWIEGYNICRFKKGLKSTVSYLNLRLF